jgi:putative membrane protein
VATATAVAAAVLRDPDAAVRDGLVGHPDGARARRLLRAGAASVAVVAAAAAGVAAGAPPLLFVPAGIVCVAVVAYALDAARSLGHALRGAFLVTRLGSIQRRTAVLARSGIIGWNLRQSWFQRRRGLATLEATTAAGAGVYAVVDLDLPGAVDLAAAAVPGLLDGFLAGAQSDSAATSSSPNQRTESTWWSSDPGSPGR